MTRILLILFAAGGLCAETNLVDRHLEVKAPPASDSELIRRLYLDLHGKLPEAQAARDFLAGTAEDKKEALIAGLFPKRPQAGKRGYTQHPFWDRWTYFFADLYRNSEVLEEGINVFHDYLYRSLMLNVGYDEMAREMLTASTVSTWTNGPANFIARSHVFQGDGFEINHEDSNDEMAITATRVFLGVNLECISCHDGKGHLEKVNPFLAKKQRADLWRQAAFFGKTYVAPEFGRSPQFIVKDGMRNGYDTAAPSVVRPKRYKAEVSPAFFLTGERPREGEQERVALARMVTGHPQFARTIVNLVWAELMGAGLTENVLDFDLTQPPPALLEALAQDFRENGHNLQRLIGIIVRSKAYQSAANDGATRQPRRMSAEQLWDAVGQVTGIQPSIKIKFSDKKVPAILQQRSPQDLDKSDNALYQICQKFGQADRYDAPANRRATMTQAAILMNDKWLRERVKVRKESRLERLLNDGQRKNPEVVEELFWIALSRRPSESERAIAVQALDANRTQGAEDLLWTMFNRLDFLFY